eukprot:CAMPEP_0176171014 /NCGR_PEP_ID=MMETSP0120_2-20121206/87546_1 /TAXON_ID=160619 /ORGANISM="Kryptoperidinium foliaceum, Strain CCMP 1326" /LENGTH=266 /DNA_ID=CAMNT_0017508825 /DNA_START=103 /DNA_END=903 /DNA_ORIENTATION=+
MDLAAERNRAARYGHTEPSLLQSMLKDSLQALQSLALEDDEAGNDCRYNMGEFELCFVVEACPVESPVGENRFSWFKTPLLFHSSATKTPSSGTFEHLPTEECSNRGTRRTPASGTFSTWSGWCELGLPVGCAVFNLALLHHDLGTTRSNNMLLQKALGLYEKALDSFNMVQATIQQPVNAAESCKSRFLALLMGFCLTNIAHIQEMLNKNSEATETIRHAFQLLFHFSTPIPSNGPSLLDIMIDQIVTNLWLHEHTTIVLAAPAA